MRIALFDTPSRRGRLVRHNRFAALAALLSAQGHDALLVDMDTRDVTPTIVTGASRESDSRDMIASAGCVDRALEAGADVLVFPLQGGLAHGVLNARACGEGAGGSVIVLWGDTPTRPLFLQGETGGGSLAPFVADAMERACLELADALIVPHAHRRSAIEGLGIALPPTVVAGLPRQSRGSQGRKAQPHRLVFVAERLAQALACAAAAEDICVRHSLHGMRVVFALTADAGSQRDVARLLHLRSRRWRFAYEIVEAESAADLARWRKARDALFVFCADDEEDVPSDFVTADDTLVFTLRDGAYDGRALAERVTLAFQTPVSEVGNGDDDVWQRALRSVQKRAVVAPSPGSVSICILHHERPALLEAALASIALDAEGDRPEIIILDNASTSAQAQACLSRVDADGRADVLRLPEPKTFAAAYNAGAARAGGDVLIFLDDDNLFAKDGLIRLRRAIEGGLFDVVVSNLDLFDDDRSDLTAARMAFIGAARTAGLFFNGFGDTCLAIRRDAFLKIGGFTDFGGPYPGADWVLLAKAQAAGLRIGVLQKPAFRYRRHSVGDALAWQKGDRGGAHTLVRDVYGDCADAAMLARYAQASWLSGD